MILVFGDETLRGFAIAMMVGIASGTYSSIFIAAPVLTEWKEREPAYRARRRNITETMGYVPVFPEDNVVARVEGHGEDDRRRTAGAVIERRAPGRDEVRPTRPTPSRPRARRRPPQRAPSSPRGRSPERAPPAETDGAGAAGDEAAEPSAAQAKRAERQRQRQRKRRKHGRRR